MSITLIDTECMSSLDIYVSLKSEAIKILRLSVFVIAIFLLGLLHLDFNQVSWHEETVYPLYPSIHYTTHLCIHSRQAMAMHLFEEWF